MLCGLNSHSNDSNDNDDDKRVTDILRIKTQSRKRVKNAGFNRKIFISFPSCFSIPEDNEVVKDENNIVLPFNIIDDNARSKDMSITVGTSSISRMDFQECLANRITFSGQPSILEDGYDLGAQISSTSYKMHSPSIICKEKNIVYILFVDDSKIFCSFFEKWVFAINCDASSPCTIESFICEWGHEAIDCYSKMVSRNKAPDLIFTDINMEYFFQQKYKNGKVCKEEKCGHQKAGIEFAKAIRGQVRATTWLEFMMQWKRKRYTSLYAYKKISIQKRCYTYAKEEGEILIPSPYAGPLIALTSDQQYIDGSDRRLFYCPEIIKPEEDYEIISGVRSKLTNKEDLIAILSHHSLY